MKKTILSLMLMVAFLPPFTASGQSLIEDIPTQTGDTTIVREWKEGYYVTYNRMPNMFSLHDPGSPSILTIPVPKEALIRDFRIIGDSIIMGGCYMYNNHPYGLIAKFSAQDFYNGSGKYEAGVYIPTDMHDNYTPQYTPCQNHITNIKRLTLYQNDSCITVAFIADNEIICDGILNYTRIGVGSAYFNGSGWVTEFLYNKNGIEKFSDIIATNDYVVAVSQTNDSSNLNIRTFEKAMFFPYCIASYFFNYCTISTFRQCLNEQTVISKVMATPIEENGFAVAYHYNDGITYGTAVREFDINTSNGDISFMQGINIPVLTNNISSWSMRDMRYLPQLNYLINLQRIYAPLSNSNENTVYWYDRSNMTGRTGRYIQGTTLHSLDILNNSMFITSGLGYSSCHQIYKELPTYAPSCANPDFSFGDPVNAVKIHKHNMPGNMNNSIAVFFEEHFKVYTEIKTEKCRHEE